MFDTDNPTKYEVVFSGLMDKLRDWNFERVAPGLGLAPGEYSLEIPFLNRNYNLDRDGITDTADGSQPDIKHRIVICHYVLTGGKGALANEWVSYRDFGDSQFFMPAFRASAEIPVAEAFSGRANALEPRCRNLDGLCCDGPIEADLRFSFRLLPNIPLLLTFIDADEDFPADARILFDANAHRWLDMECLAVAGIILSELLISD